MKLGDLLDIPAYFDPINLVEGVISTFIRAEWDRAWRRAGVLGLLWEIIRCVLNLNTHTIYLDRYCGWSGIQAERLLKRYGIPLWDRHLAGESVAFCVKKRQARWAEYVLMRAGCTLNRRLADTRNSAWAKCHASGVVPPQGWTQPRRKPNRNRK